jgi:hypothetical protein
VNRPDHCPGAGQREAEDHDREETEATADGRVYTGEDYGHPECPRQGIRWHPQRGMAYGAAPQDQTHSSALRVPEGASRAGGSVILVEVSKLSRETRKPKKLWLWWHGEGEADLDFLWRAYVRRFDLEHTIRFLKQTLGWTTPRLRVIGTFA